MTSRYVAVAFALSGLFWFGSQVVACTPEQVIRPPGSSDTPMRVTLVIDGAAEAEDVAPSVIGSQVLVNGTRTVSVGVAPPTFQPERAGSLWIPKSGSI